MFSFFSAFISSFGKKGLLPAVLKAKACGATEYDCLKIVRGVYRKKKLDTLYTCRKSKKGSSRGKRRGKG